MNRAEFEQLRALSGKVIDADIEFKASSKTSPCLVFEQVQVRNDLNWEVLLNGTYKPFIPAVSFNFVIKGLGPICRLDVNGTIHGEQGRTHKHDLHDEEDPRRNLPQAISRQDLKGKTARQVWELLCQQANIVHTGRFFDPENGSS